MHADRGHTSDPYELYFNSDNTECLVFERYRDSQAAATLAWDRTLAFLKRSSTS